MKEETQEEKIRTLRSECHCTENEARNALMLSRGDMCRAREIVKAKASRDTRYVGGVSGQVVELPEANHAIIDKLMQKSEENRKDTGAQSVKVSKFVVYKNGIMAGDKFHRMSSKKRDELLDSITRTGDIPRELFGIKQGEMVDVDFSLQTDESYQEMYPGQGHTLSGPMQASTEEPGAKAGEPSGGGVGDSINLGEGGPVFRLMIAGRRVKVTMRKGATMLELIDFLKQKGLHASTLLSGEKVVRGEDSSDLYDRDMLTLK